MSGNLTVTEAFNILHKCRYCDSFTGDDTTGCAGRPTPCKYWGLDRITMPRWAAEYADLIDDPYGDSSFEPAVFSQWDV